MWSRTRSILGMGSALLAGLLALVPSQSRSEEPAAEAPDPAEVTIGERLFLETRFAEFFARYATDVNAPLPSGDPVVDNTATTAEALPGPFAGQSINCRSCHLVDEQLDTAGGGMRTYADFAPRSPIPSRADERDPRVMAARNSPALVNASLPRAGGVILHFDGEFPSLESLVRGTLTGRNYGWLPGEVRRAVAHIARVIRSDDGSGELAQESGGAYARVLAGTDPTLPDELRLPPPFRIDVGHASDDAIVDAASRLVAAYVEQLVFERDEEGAFSGSPYDAFLARNALPRAPRPRESPAEYTARLRSALDRLKRPVFVDDGAFEFHAQSRRFGARELDGLRVFLARAPKRALRPGELKRGTVGNCATCHPAPDFTDFRFHNTGVTQREYDGIHGDGAFERLDVPSLARRARAPARFLPATEQHPGAAEPFRAVASADRPGRTDLGAWNVFANADFPAAQPPLWRALCDGELDAAGVADGPPLRRLFSVLAHCRAESLLPRSIAKFKTPGLRDLSHSAPYMHDGAFETLENVIAFYRSSAASARAGTLRNAAPELSGIALTDRDQADLAAFLRALNEDYQ